MNKLELRFAECGDPPPEEWFTKPTVTDELLAAVHIRRDKLVAKNKGKP